MQLVHKQLHHFHQTSAVKRSDKKVWTVLIHVLAWVAFLLLPAIFKPRFPGTSLSFSFVLDDLLEPPRWTNGLLLIVIFYFNYYFVFSKLYLKRKYGILAVAVSISFVSFFLLNSYLTPAEIKMRPSSGFEALGNSFNLFMFMVVYAASFAICLYEQWQQTREQMMNARISFLKAQINPHFLFNTLNSIYSLTLVKSDKAPDAVVKLSAMMRYAVSEADHDHVSLAKEIEYITNYINLQELRLTEKVKITCEVAGNTEGKKIAPFLMIPFVENAFKYGVNAEEDSDIRIRIYIDEKDMQLNVRNNKVYLRPGIEHGTGLGIDTTRKRLEALYPGKNSLSITDGEKDFDVSLKITLS